MRKRLNWKKNQILKTGNELSSLLLVTIGMIMLPSFSNAQNIVKTKSIRMNADSIMVQDAFIYVGPKDTAGLVGGDYPCDARIAISLEDSTKHYFHPKTSFIATLGADGEIVYIIDESDDSGKRSFENEVTVQQLSLIHI